LGAIERFPVLMGMGFLLAFALLLSGATTAAPIPERTVAIQWNNAALQGVRDAKLGAPVAARALAITHTCMYGAWAAGPPLRFL
jgi:hypothetical protein